MAKIYVPAHTRADGTRVKGYTREIGGKDFVIERPFGMRSTEKLSRQAATQRKNRIISGVMKGELTGSDINPFAVRRTVNTHSEYFETRIRPNARKSSGMYGRPKPR